MATATEQIVSRIGEMESKLDGLQGFVKSMSDAASKAGTTPSGLMHSVSQGGKAAGLVLGPDGVLRPTPFDPKGRRIGKSVDPTTGYEGTFGDYAKTLFQHSKSMGNDPKAREKLGKYGVQSMSHGEEGRIIKTALAESSGVTGGYTVPPMFLEQLQTLQIENAIIEPRAYQQPMSTLTVTIPSLDITTNYGSGQTPFVGGIKAYWGSEGTTFNESEPQFRSTELTAHLLQFYAVASMQLLEDEAVGLDAWLTQLFGWVIPWTRDYAFLNGTGVGQPLGLYNCPATIAVQRASSNHIKWNDISQMLARFYYMLGDKDAVWVASPQCIPEIHTLVDPAGNPVFQARDKGVQEAVAKPKGAQQFGMLDGKPLFITEKAPALGSTGDLALFDASKYVVGQRLEMEVDASPIPGFLQYQMYWRIVSRLDGQPWLNNPVTLQNGYQVSPFVMLHS